MKILNQRQLSNLLIGGVSFANANLLKKVGVFDFVFVVFITAANIVKKIFS
jgi:hypothetical protein